VLNSSAAWQHLGALHRVLNEFEGARVCFQNGLAVLDGVPFSMAAGREVLDLKRQGLFLLGEVQQVLRKSVEARTSYEASLAVHDLSGHDEPDWEEETKELIDRL